MKAAKVKLNLENDSAPLFGHDVDYSAQAQDITVFLYSSMKYQ